MAIGVYTDLINYNEQFYGGFIETVKTNLDVFNAAGFNTMNLLTRFHIGLRSQEAFFSRSNGVYRRTLGSTAAHTPANLPADEIKAVKLFDAVHYETTLQSFKLQGFSEDEIAFVAGQQAAGDIMEGWREAAVSALVGAYKLAALQPGGADVLVNDITAASTTNLNSTALIDTIKLFGDKSARIAAWVMHSACYWDLVKDQHTSTTADGVADMVIMQGTPATLGKPVIIVDSPALINPNGSAADSYNTFGLVPNAITVEESEERSTLVETVGGLNNLVYRVQSEYAFTVKLKGLSYTSATDNPSNATLATNAVWTKKHTSKKDLPGVMIESLIT